MNFHARLQRLEASLTPAPAHDAPGDARTTPAELEAYRDVLTRSILARPTALTPAEVESRWAWFGRYRSDPTRWTYTARGMKPPQR